VTFVPELAVTTLAFVFETDGDSLLAAAEMIREREWVGVALWPVMSSPTPKSPEFWFTYGARLLSLYKHTTTSNSSSHHANHSKPSASTVSL